MTTLADRRRSAAEIADDVLATHLFGRLWAEGFRLADVLALGDGLAAWTRLEDGPVPEHVRARVIDEMTYCERVERERSAA